MSRLRIIALIITASLVATVIPTRAQDDSPRSAFERAIVNTALVLASDIDIETDGDWAVLSAIGAEPGEPVLLIARRMGAGWRALTPQTDAVDVYNDWLATLPEPLVSGEAKDALKLATRAEVRTAQTLTPFSGYRLPYPNTWPAFMSQGPIGQFSHTGYWAIDLVLPTSTGYTSTIVAAKSGVVVYVKDVSNIGGLRASLSGYANGVVIRHGPGEYSWYWHLAHRSVPADVQPGKSIEAGTVLGWMGSTGYSSGPHLHFQVSESFIWAGCNAVTGCTARETRADRAPFNKSLRGADFEEIQNENSWNGCSTRASCAMNTASANALSADDGAVLYWTTDFRGPGWKTRSNSAATLPAWLAGRNGSLGMPEGWWVRLVDTAGQANEFEARQAALPGALRPGAIRIAPLITVTKYVRNDLPVAWPYQFGSADARVARVGETDSPAFAVKPCTWRSVLIPPGKHALHAAVQERGPGRAELHVARWPYEPLPCAAVLADPGLLPVALSCATPPADALEPNDAVAAAAPLTFTLAQQHATIAPGDIDWAVITVPVGTRFAVTTDGLDADADTVLQLFAADNSAELARSDDADGYGSRVTWVGSGSGVYHVRVTQWDPGISGCGTAFTLRVERLWQSMLPVLSR